MKTAVDTNAVSTAQGHLSCKVKGGITCQADPGTAHQPRDTLSPGDTLSETDAASALIPGSRVNREAWGALQESHAAAWGDATGTREARDAKARPSVLVGCKERPGGSSGNPQRRGGQPGG